MIETDVSNDRYSSVDWVLFHKVEGCRSDSLSGHKPGLWIGPGWGTCKRQPIDVSLSC